MPRIPALRTTHLVTAGYWSADGGCTVRTVGTYATEREACDAAAKAAAQSAWVNVDRRVPMSATTYREEPVAVFTKDESGKVVRDIVEEV